MSVTAVAHLPPRDRCRACRQRFGGDDRRRDLLRPWVTFGTDQTPEVERDETGKLWRHNRLLVCGGCLRKAAQHLDDTDKRVAELEVQVAKAEAARDAAIGTSRELNAIVTERLGSFAPEQIADLSGMDGAELREYAKGRGVKLGPGNHSADKLREMIRAAIEVVE